MRLRQVALAAQRRHRGELAVAARDRRQHARPSSSRTWCSRGRTPAHTLEDAVEINVRVLNTLLSWAEHEPAHRVEATLAKLLKLVR